MHLLLELFFSSHYYVVDVTKQVLTTKTCSSWTKFWDFFRKDKCHDGRETV